MGWTRRSAAVSVLLVMEEHRREAGLRLVSLREARGWTQPDLAHESGVSIKTISRFENGKHDGRPSTIKALARALEVDQFAITGPPPAPLGLGTQNGAADQLDRIEAMLRQLLDRFGLSQPEPVDHEREAVRVAKAARDQEREHDQAAPPKAPRKKKPVRAA